MSHKIFRMNFIVLFYICLFFAISTCFAGEKLAATKSPSVAIGILVPLQHKALDEMIAGFEQEMLREYKGKVSFIVKNAQGDMNIQRSILQEFAHDQVALVVPIGTTAFEMAMSVIRDKPILGLAANFTEADRSGGKRQNVTNVMDEIPVAKQLEFASRVIPNLHKAAIVYSSTEKSMRDTEDFLRAAQDKNVNVKVQKLMIQQLSELYTVTQQIAKDNQAIFIEKDHVVVNGMNTLTKAAVKLQIPVISADDGSVQNGAAFAVGVAEKQIGVEGAKLAVQFFEGTDMGKLPVTIIKKLYVFINPNMAKQQGIAVGDVERTAKQFGYEVVKFDELGGVTS